MKIEEHPVKSKYMTGTKVGIAAGHEGNRKKVCAPCGRKILDKERENLIMFKLTSLKSILMLTLILKILFSKLEFVKYVGHLFKISTDPTKDMNQNRPILTYLVLGMLQQKAELKWYVYPISLCPGEYELILKGSYNYFLQHFPHGIKY